jgi:hypothetical protein
MRRRNREWFIAARSFELVDHWQAAGRRLKPILKVLGVPAQTRSP